MKFKDIPWKLNDIASKSRYDISTLYQLRKRAKSKQQLPNLIFSAQSIKEYYAFHNGGRNELQFNIGVEEHNGQEIFRYALAFSFEGGINLRNPIEVLTPKVELFNEFFKKNPKFFSGFSMWHYMEGSDNRKRSPDYPVAEIPKAWVLNKNFIAIGKYFKKPPEKLNDNDLNQILECFDYLLKVYKFVEVDYGKIPTVQDKISKICWNEEGWIKPSGMKGKSTDKESYERIYGFGHEEWLLDFTKLINGYHYGALQSVSKHASLYAGETFNIKLYSHNKQQKTWYWLGQIKNVEVLYHKQSVSAYNYYMANDWLKQMRENIESVGGNVKEFDSSYGWGIFNIRFKPKDFIPHSDTELLTPFQGGERITHTRYTLLDTNQHVGPKLNKNKTIGDLILKNGGFGGGPAGNISRTFESKTIEYPNIHKLIQDGFIVWLRKKYSSDEVYREVESEGLRTKIDIVRISLDKSRIFYEVKSYPSIMMSLRIAIGQLLEYAHFPQRILAKKLYVVSNLHIEDDHIKYYIKHLNMLSKFQIGYIEFDTDTNEVIEIVE